MASYDYVQTHTGFSALTVAEVVERRIDRCMSGVAPMTRAHLPWRLTTRATHASIPGEDGAVFLAGITWRSAPNHLFLPFPAKCVQPSAGAAGRPLAFIALTCRVCSEVH